MQKKLIKMAFIILLFSFTTLVFLGNTSVKATTLEEEENITLDEILNSEDKIMMYNAITDETTEVNMEELKKVVMEAYGLENNEEIIDTTFSNKTTISHNVIANIISTYGTLTRYTNTTGTVQRTICKVCSDQADGSACLVGNNIALTSAHLIWNENTKAKRTNLKFYAGYSNGSYTGACGWSKVYYSENWMSTTGTCPEYDWAICVLESNLGEYAGGYLDVTSSGNLISEAGNVIDLYGYPSAYDSGVYQYKSGGYIIFYLTKYITYSATSGNGFSGGPVLNSRNVVCAVHCRY